MLQKNSCVGNFLKEVNVACLRHAGGVLAERGARPHLSTSSILQKARESEGLVLFCLVRMPAICGLGDPSPLASKSSCSSMRLFV